MRLDKLTSKFQLAIADAQSLALGRDHQYIEATHLMLALLNQDSGSIRPILADLEVDINLLRSQLSAELDRIPKVMGIGGDILRDSGHNVIRIIGPPIPNLNHLPHGVLIAKNPFCR